MRRQRVVGQRLPVRQRANGQRGLEVADFVDQPLRVERVGRDHDQQALRAFAQPLRSRPAAMRRRSPAAARWRHGSLRTGVSARRGPTAGPRARRWRLRDSQMKNGSRATLTSCRTRSLLYEARFAFHPGRDPRCVTPFVTSDSFLRRAWAPAWAPTAVRSSTWRSAASRCSNTRSTRCWPMRASSACSSSSRPPTRAGGRFAPTPGASSSFRSAALRARSPCATDSMRSPGVSKTTIACSCTTPRAPASARHSWQH